MYQKAIDKYTIIDRPSPQDIPNSMQRYAMLTMSLATVREAAAMLNLTPRAVYYAIRKGNIEIRRVNKQYYIPVPYGIDKYRNYQRTGRLV